MRNRTADLLLTMETLCLLSYRGASMPRKGAAPTDQDTHWAADRANSLGVTHFEEVSPKSVPRDLGH